MDPSDAGIDAGFSTFAPRLDHVVGASDITRVDGDDFDKHYFPEGAYVDGAQAVILLDSATFFRPEVQQDEGGYYVETIAGRVPENDYHLGLEYVGRVDLPSFYFLQDKKADRVNIPQIQYMYVNFYYSGRYTVEVDRVGYDTYTQDIDVADTNVYLADGPAVEEDGSSIVPIFCRGDLVKVSVLSKDPFPQSITNYSWQGQYNTRNIKRL